MFDLIWETSAVSAAQLRIFLREAKVPSEKWQIWRALNAYTRNNRQCVPLNHTNTTKMP